MRTTELELEKGACQKQKAVEKKEGSEERSEGITKQRTNTAEAVLRIFRAEIDPLEARAVAPLRRAAHKLATLVTADRLWDLTTAPPPIAAEKNAHGM